LARKFDTSLAFGLLRSAIAMSADQLNCFLGTRSYLGSVSCATQQDFKQCKALSADSIDHEKFPHLCRWHQHISNLMLRSTTVDWQGNPVPAGEKPNLSGPATPAPQAKQQQEKKASPKQAAKASPKQAAKGKKEEQPKKGKKDKTEGKEEEKELTPEEQAEARKKQLKKVIKEGGKRGVEIEGAADMGGLQFFCTSMDEPQGDIEFLVESMQAMNAKSDPTEEERKGGSGHVGKMIFSAGTDQLAIVAYVPKEKQAELSCEEWLQKVVSGQTGGKVLTKAKDICTGCVPTDGNKNVFPLKIREPMILEANNFLRKLGLFPEDDGSEDEFVFGDDDFPS